MDFVPQVMNGLTCEDCDGFCAASDKWLDLRELRWILCRNCDDCLDLLVERARGYGAA